MASIGELIATNPTAVVELATLREHSAEVWQLYAGVETLSGTLLDQADAAHAGATLLRERLDRASADTLERQQQINERFATCGPCWGTISRSVFGARVQMSKCAHNP
jgi:hypothetical protein